MIKSKLGFFKKANIIRLLIIFGIAIMLLLIASLTKILPFKSTLPEYPAECVGCNIVLISIDTLRADRVSALGYTRNTTPVLDKLSENSYIFTQVITVSPWTLPSHMSMFTGLYPSEHKMTNKVLLFGTQKEVSANLSLVSPGAKTLAELLKEKGYLTAGFTGGAGLDSEFGFDSGFDIYDDDINFGGFKTSIPKAIDWVKSNKDGKFFLFVHGYDVHGQFVPEAGYDNRFLDFEYKGSLTGSKQEQKELREEGISRGNIFLDSEDVRYLSSIYDEKVNRADEWVGVFLSDYENIDVANKTVFVITSDHGEELYEHGRIDHGHSLYEELVRVPLIVSVPDLNDKVTIDKPVSNVDILPTIMSLIGYADELDQKGIRFGKKNLLSPSYEPPEAVFMETDYRYATHLRGARSSKYKLIKDLEFGFEEVFNLNSDPGETKSILADSQKEVANLRIILQDYISKLSNDKTQ